MITSLDRIYIKQGLRTSDFIDDLNAISEHDHIPKILELWKGIEYEDYLTNPAICASRFLDDGQHSPDGCFKVVIGLPDGSEIMEDDLIKWATPARGTLRHNPRFVRSVLSCEEDINDYLKTTPHHCGKLSCPECAAYEISYNATQQAIKLMSGAKYAENRNKSDRFVQHLTVSPPEALYYKFITWDGFQEMKKYAVKVATEAGIKGGMIIFHPYRQNGRNDDDILPGDYDPTATNDGDKHHARFAPHFHVLGFGWIAPASSEFVNSHKGWIYKAIRTGENRIRTLPEVVGAINYLMSHVGLISEDSPAQIPRMQTISWIGQCNSHVLTLICEIRVYEEQLCEECGHNIVVHAVNGYNEELKLQGNLYKYQKFPIYADMAHKDEMITFYEENKLDPLGILQYIEKNPEKAVCYLSSRELDRRLTVPLVIRAKKDNTLHISDVYCTATVPAGIQHKRDRRLREKIDLKIFKSQRQKIEHDPEEPPEALTVPLTDVAVFRMMT